MATRSYAGSPQHFNGSLGQAEQGSDDVMSQMRSATEAVQSQAQHVVADYPLSTALAVFGVGVGVGVVLGSALFTSNSNYASHSLPSGFASWLPSGSQGSWLNNSHVPNWGESFVQGAKNMCGY